MINLLYAGNEGVFDGLLISLLSALRHTSEPITAYVMTMDLTEQNPKYTPIRTESTDFLDRISKEYNENNSVRLIDVGALYKEKMLHSPNALTSYTPYTFLRLFADKLPELPEKLLYLDTDTVVCDDLSSLYNTDISGYELAASLDHYGKIFMGINYFNAGVLLLNLKKIKETGLFEKTVAKCAVKKIFLPDQTALNRLVKKKLILKRKYNEQKYHGRKSVIQHFTKTIIWFPLFHTRNIKPWHTELFLKTFPYGYEELISSYKTLKEKYERKDSQNA